VFPKWGIVDRWLENRQSKKGGKLGTLGTWTRHFLFIRGGRLRASAMYILPMYFFFDFAAMLEQVIVGSDAAVDNTNHAAHVGGLFAGSAFYFAFGRSLKGRYAPHLLIENDPRRWYLFGLTAVAAMGVWALKGGYVLNISFSFHTSSPPPPQNNTHPNTPTDLQERKKEKEKGCIMLLEKQS
jgi:hypothetical protein